jgi:hypothetical protein
MMMTGKIVLIILLGFLARNTLYAQRVEPFSEAKGSGVDAALYDFDKWNFSIGDTTYEILKSGKATRKDAKDRITNFRIKLEVDEELERVVYFFEYKGDLILLCESSVFEAGSGFVTRLDYVSLQPEWKTDIPGFNIAKGLVEDDFAYLAAIGFVGRISLATGKYIWKHDDLYRRYKESGAFNIFLTPQLSGNSVIFKEEDTNNQIDVNKASGKIVKVLVK